MKRHERRSRWLVGAAGIGLAGLVSLTGACSKKSTSSGSGGGGKPAAMTFQTTDCGKCAQTSCTQAFSACQSDPTCATYLDCLFKCPVDAQGNADPMCDAACVPAQSSTESDKARSAVTGCRFYGAGASCPTCGIPNTPQSGNLNQVCTPRPNPPTACRACYWQKCCHTWDACFDGSNPDCDALTTCAQACTTAPLEPCMKACFDAHPNSVPTLLAQQSCALSNCSSDQPNCDASTRDACETCSFVTCGDPFVSLLSTGPGFLLFVCTEDCGKAGMGPSCTEACVQAHSEAQDAFFLWAECVTDRCGSTC